MSPKPFLPDSKPHRTTCPCNACTDARFRARNPHLYGYEDKPGLTIALRTLLVCLALGGAIWAGGIYWAATAWGQQVHIHPVKAPASLLRARAACPITKPLRCRAALVRAYKASEWQRKQNLDLARLLVGNVTNWTCIHRGEAAWTDTRDPYWGGLQMDRTFMHQYGEDMIRRHHGGLANTWTPREQLIVAQRAYQQNRGYHPWPNTARACGLIS